MSAVLFALIAAFLATTGARDQVLLAGLGARDGLRPALLFVALITGGVASGIAGVIARDVVGPTHSLRLLAAAAGLGLGGLELILRRPRALPQEPTRSLGAAALVLLADQVADPARFIIFALAVSSQAPLESAAGGWVGSALALGLGGSYAGWWLHRAHEFAILRRIAGALLVLAALAVLLWRWQVAG